MIVNRNRDRVRVRLPEDAHDRAAYLQRIQALLPANFAAHTRPMESDAPNRAQLWAVITGEDFAGWTLEGYVLPRLASALIFPELLPTCPSWTDAFK